MAFEFGWILEKWKEIAGGVVATVTGGITIWRAVKAKNGAQAGRDISSILKRGKWKGHAKEIDANGHPLIDYDVTWRFFDKAGELTCFSTADFMDSKGIARKEEYTLACHLISDRFLQIDFVVDDDSQVSFGTELLHFSDTGKSFSGKFVGWSSERQTFVSGGIEGKLDRQ